MNGPNTMYKIKPIIKLTEEIDLPKCMYKMKNIQQSHSSCEEKVLNKSQSASITEQVPLPEMAALEIRQEAILEQLAQLKKQMAALRNELKALAVSPLKQIVTKDIAWDPSLQNEVIRDIVIIASPKYPPYSLQALQQLWSGNLSLGMQSHLHSSLSSIPKDLHNVFNTTSYAVCQGPMLNVILVWKDVGPETELHVSPTKTCSIKGEVNILRYLSRLGPPAYNYELIGDPVFAAKIDELLDACYTIVHSRTVKERQSLVRYLNKQLGKCQFLTGEKMTIADIAAWSLFRQLSLPISDFTNNMNSWLDRCSNVYRQDEKSEEEEMIGEMRKDIV